MRISKAYWIWGLFSSEDTDYLNHIKDKVQNVLKSPSFDAHITLAGPFLKIEKPFLKRLKTIARNNSGINLEVNGYHFNEEIYKSFYISINNSEYLFNLRRNIYELKGIDELKEFDLKNDYLPHISLSYGKHTILEKKRLILKLPKFNKTIKISQIALVDVNENMNFWKILKIFKLKEF